MKISLDSRYKINYKSDCFYLNVPFNKDNLFSYHIEASTPKHKAKRVYAKKINPF